MSNKVTTILDMGNYTTKFLGVNTGTFSSKISTDFQAYQDGFERIELNGVVTYIGTGELDKEFNKSARNYLPILLYGVCKANSTEDVIDTNLTLLLPITQMSKKTVFIEELKGKDFSFKFNGKDRVVNINDILVLPEGYMSYYSLEKEDRADDICILDLGSRTVNICCLLHGKVEKLNTVKLGSVDFYAKVKSIEDSRGNGYEIEDIERLIKRGTIKVTKKMYGEFMNEILNAIKPYVNIKNYTTYFTGGTTIMLEDIIKENLSFCKIHNDPVNSNIKGAVIASKLVWENATNVK